MTTIRIKDRDYEIGVLSLDAVEKIWPMLESVNKRAKEVGADNVQMTLPETINYSCEVLSIALADSGHTDLTKDVLKKAIGFPDIAQVQRAIEGILADAGLSKGEHVPAEGGEASSSTATSAPSTQSSSPLAAEQPSET